MIDPQTATNWERKGLSPTNQWSTAFPYHALEPDKPIDAPLATRWLRLAQVADDADLRADGRLTRGEFLRQLFERVKK